MLIDKSDNGSKQVVTQEMMQKKSDEEQFEGVIVVNCKDMDKEQFCGIVDGIRPNLYNKAKSCMIDTHGL